jgi:drug/metabolite transporter (DMT)-like permease
MMNVIRPRLRKPAWTVLAGAVIAAALVIRGGPHWWLWVSLVAIATAGRAFACWAWAGEDDDVAALAGSRADERQKQISLRSRALACNLVAVAAFAGLAAGLALRGSWWWPFAVILGILGFGYLFGLSSYGVAEEGPADDPETEHQPPAPVGQ